MGIIPFIISVAVLVLVLKIIALPFKIIIKLNIGTIILTGLLGIPGLIIGLIITMLI